MIIMGEGDRHGARALAESYVSLLKAAGGGSEGGLAWCGHLKPQSPHPVRHLQKDHIYLTSMKM